MSLVVSSMAWWYDTCDTYKFELKSLWIWIWANLLFWWPGWFRHVSSLFSELKQTGCWWLLYMLCQFSSASCVCKPPKQSDYNAADPLKIKIKCLHNFVLDNGRMTGFRCCCKESLHWILSWVLGACIEWPVSWGVVGWDLSCHNLSGYFQCIF